jgi:hypothetical protein
MTVPAARDLSVIGVRVNTICPGIIDTPIYGFSDNSGEYKARLVAPVVFPKRMGRPDEFGHLVLSLIGNDYMNAEVVRFDGGIRFQPKLPPATSGCRLTCGDALSAPLTVVPGDRLAARLLEEVPPRSELGCAAASPPGRSARQRRSLAGSRGTGGAEHGVLARLGGVGRLWL